jgi:nucleotide-binding universal stress UspA family protein
MIDRILVALDGSARAPGVFDVAADIGARFGATLQPFRAIFVPPEFPPAAAGSRADPLPSRLIQQALDDVARIVSQARPRNLVTKLPIVRIGDPSRLIITVSDEMDADLIVIGSHGYHGLDRILGTTAARVANLAHRNVLVVHERADRLAAMLPQGPSPYRGNGG